MLYPHAKGRVFPPIGVVVTTRPLISLPVSTEQRTIVATWTRAREGSKRNLSIVLWQTYRREGTAHTYVAIYIYIYIYIRLYT